MGKDATSGQPTKGNPASAQPIRGLSERAKKIASPRAYGISVGPRYMGEIPQAFRTTKG